MNLHILCPIFVLTAVFNAGAALIPYYMMDSLVLLSEVIVLCDEKDLHFKEVRHETWTETKTLVRCNVVRAFKGDIKTKSEFTVEYNSIFRRHLLFKGSYTEMDAARNVKRVVPPEYLPPGRALLFLKKTKDSDSYFVVTAKLLQGDSVLQFGQFKSNPGPLVLAEQKPENIRLSANQKYGEAQLIEDLLVALEKADSLREPVPMNAWEALK